MLSFRRQTTGQYPRVYPCPTGVGRGDRLRSALHVDGAGEARDGGLAAADVLANDVDPVDADAAAALHLDARATSVSPAATAAWKVMCASMPAAIGPCEFDARPNAESARAKIAPPWPPPLKLRWRASTVIATSACPGPPARKVMPSVVQRPSLATQAGDALAPAVGVEGRGRGGGGASHAGRRSMPLPTWRGAFVASAPADADRIAVRVERSEQLVEAGARRAR